MSHEAFSDTEVCVAPAKVYRVRTEFAVSAGNLPLLLAALHRFADEKGYFYLIDDGKTPVDGFLVKKRTDEGVHIRASSPGVISAEMTECGSEEFWPYWKEFLDFKASYENRPSK
jgi:hypothetical protein